MLIEVPDLEILTEGFGMADAVEMARDAIGLKGICYEDEGKEIPTPRTMAEVNSSKGTFAGLVKASCHLWISIFKSIVGEQIIKRYGGM